MNGLTQELDVNKESLIESYTELLADYSDNEVVACLSNPAFCCALINMEILGTVASKNYIGRQEGTSKK